jgi:hypothetical protein
MFGSSIEKDKKRPLDIEDRKDIKQEGRRGSVFRGTQKSILGLKAKGRHLR